MEEDSSRDSSRGSSSINSPPEVRCRKKKLLNLVQKQLDFYFCDSNLNHDRFLRKEIEQSKDGYVNLYTMLKFNKLKQLTSDVTVLAKAAGNSTALVLSEDHTKIKRKDKLKGIENTDSRTVYVEEFPQNVDHDWLKLVFSTCGNVEYISLPRFNHNKQVKGFAFIEFTTTQEAQKACEMLNTIPKHKNKRRHSSDGHNNEEGSAKKKNNRSRNNNSESENTTTKPQGTRRRRSVSESSDTTGGITLAKTTRKKQNSISDSENGNCTKQSKRRRSVSESSDGTPAGAVKTIKKKPNSFSVIDEQTVDHSALSDIYKQPLATDPRRLQVPTTVAHNSSNTQDNILPLSTSHRRRRRRDTSASSDTDGEQTKIKSAASTPVKQENIVGSFSTSVDKSLSSPSTTTSTSFPSSSSATTSSSSSTTTSSSSSTTTSSSSSSSTTTSSSSSTQLLPVGNNVSQSQPVGNGSTATSQTVTMATNKRKLSSDDEAPIEKKKTSSIQSRSSKVSLNSVKTSATIDLVKTTECSHTEGDSLSKTNNSNVDSHTTLEDSLSKTSDSKVQVGDSLATVEIGDSLPTVEIVDSLPTVEIGDSLATVEIGDSLATVEGCKQTQPSEAKVCDDTGVAGESSSDSKCTQAAVHEKRKLTADSTAEEHGKRVKVGSDTDNNDEICTSTVTTEHSKEVSLDVVKSEASDGEVKEEEDSKHVEEKKKKKKKRNRQHHKKKPAAVKDSDQATILPPLHVIPKCEWLLLKNEYKRLQRIEMSELKRNLKVLKIEKVRRVELKERIFKTIAEKNKTTNEEEHNREEEKEEKTTANEVDEEKENFEAENENAATGSCSGVVSDPSGLNQVALQQQQQQRGFEIVPGSVLAMKTSSQNLTRKDVKSEVSPFGEVAYVDYVDGVFQGFVRFKTKGDAEKVLAAQSGDQKTEWEFELRKLSDIEEEAYVLKAEEDRMKKYDKDQRKKMKKGRGIDKISRDVEVVSNHVHFT